MIALKTHHFEDPTSLDQRVRGFDSFKFGHQGRWEREVQALQADGMEAFRYFNVFHTAPEFPQWGSYYADVHAFLTSVDGWIDGVRYAFYDRDSIIDHTRPEVSEGVARIISAWADSIDSDQVFLDVTFHQLDDWMLRPGDEWPWPPEEHAARNLRWHANMRSLIETVGAAHPEMINGSSVLPARAVLYENQVSRGLRGDSPWEELMARIVSGETIVGLHVGHHRLQLPHDILNGERLVLAAWLIADEGYILVEAEGREHEWAREIQAAGYRDFVASGPALEVRSGVWQRAGKIGEQVFLVEADLPNQTGRVTP
jgi:hypothetical protein